MAARKRPSGGASMTATGKQPVQLWFTAADLEILRTAAQADGRPVTQLLAHYGLQAARKINKNSVKTA